ncbi:TPA: hypothetical protein N0F65_006164 [Lagenidium giganteum]|uniref:Uncharacterized protein n=1 Tax=Lagenidium giganteum TaxID=4803 RepID=A0AAV2Z8F1_9STRA|nr:TPA: hypothetical protein N0F65_006164 [Lagenidium giganteum]
MLVIELVEGEVRQQQKPHSALSEGTAVRLRLTEHHRGSGRTVVADRVRP